MGHAVFTNFSCMITPIHKDGRADGEQNNLATNLRRRQKITINAALLCEAALPLYRSQTRSCFVSDFK